LEEEEEEEELELVAIHPWIDPAGLLVKERQRQRQQQLEKA